MNDKQNQNQQETDQEQASPESYPVKDFNPVFETKHDWKQQGNYLVCFSCTIRHGTQIPTDYIMTGMDEDGLPIFKNLTEELK